MLGHSHGINDLGHDLAGNVTFSITWNRLLLRSLILTWWTARRITLWNDSSILSKMATYVLGPCDSGFANDWNYIYIGSGGDWVYDKFCRSTSPLIRGILEGAFLRTVFSWWFIIQAMCNLTSLFGSNKWSWSCTELVSLLCDTMI